MLNTWLGKQLSNPRGFFSKWVGSYMAKGNAVANHWTLELMELMPEDIVLEIGMGNGQTIHSITSNHKLRRICGIDISSSMIKEATILNEELISKGRVEIKHGNVEAIPYEDEFFSKVFTVHTIYFWSDIYQGMQEIRRVLKTNGAVFITFMLSEELAKRKRTREFSRYTPDEMKRELENSGFEDVTIHLNQSFCCISSRKA